MIHKSIHEILGPLKSLRSPRLHHGDRDAPLRIAWAWGLVPCITPQKRTAGTWKYRRKERERHLQYKPSQTLGLMLVFKLYNLFFSRQAMMPRELQMPLGWGFVRQISAQPAVVYAQRFFQPLGLRMERRWRGSGKRSRHQIFHQILFET